MADPFFSIVVPTRNRGHELHHTLRTCLAQDFNVLGSDSYEILVSDKCSDADIPAVVRALGSPITRYVRTDRYLSMTDSWEFAVSQARGKFVGIVCTDDGYLFDTLSNVYAILNNNDVKVVTFQGGYYYWPTCTDSALRNKLLVPTFVFDEGVQPAARLVADSLKTLYYGRLPCFLNSFCDRELLDAIRRKRGRIFDSYCPDVYSGFLIANEVDRIYVSNRIMLVGGVSGGSTGGNAFADPEGAIIKEHLSKFADGEALTQGLIAFPFATNYIVDSAVKALAAPGSGDVMNRLDYTSYVTHCFRQAIMLPDAANRQAALHAVRGFVEAHARAGLSWKRLFLKSLRWRIQQALPTSLVRIVQRQAYRPGRTSGGLANRVVDAADLGIHDVYDAARYLTTTR